MHPRARGFTLVEALVALAIASLLVATALPAAADALARTRASAARATLLASLTTAIGHAAATGVEVVLCPGGPGGCRDTMDWSGGWIVFADLDGNRRKGPTETLVQQAPALADGVALRSTTGRRRLVLQPNGGNAGSNVTFTLCDRRGVAGAVTLVLANHGRLRAGEPARGAAEDCVAALR